MPSRAEIQPQNALHRSHRPLPSAGPTPGISCTSAGRSPHPARRRAARGQQPDAPGTRRGRRPARQAGRGAIGRRRQGSGPAGSGGRDRWALRSAGRRVCLRSLAGLGRFGRARPRIWGCVFSHSGSFMVTSPVGIDHSGRDRRRGTDCANSEAGPTTRRSGSLPVFPSARSCVGCVGCAGSSSFHTKPPTSQVERLRNLYRRNGRIDARSTLQTARPRAPGWPARRRRARRARLHRRRQSADRRQARVHSLPARPGEQAPLCRLPIFHLLHMPRVKVSVIPMPRSAGLSDQRARELRGDSGRYSCSGSSPADLSTALTRTHRH